MSTKPFLTPIKKLDYLPLEVGLKYLYCAGLKYLYCAGLQRVTAVLLEAFKLEGGNDVLDDFF